MKRFRKEISFEMRRKKNIIRTLLAICLMFKYQVKYLFVLSNSRETIFKRDVYLNEPIERENLLFLITLTE